MIDNLDDNDRRIIVASGRQGPGTRSTTPASGNQQPPINGNVRAASGGANNTPTPSTRPAAAIPVRRRRLRSQQLDDDGRIGAEPGLQRQRLQRRHVLGQGERHPARRVRGSPSSRPTAAGRAPAELLERLRRQHVRGADAPTGRSSPSCSPACSARTAAPSPAFNPSELMSIAVQAPGGTFDFWIDEVPFTRGRRHHRHGAAPGARRHGRRHHRRAARGGATGRAARPAAPARPAPAAACTGADAAADHQRRPERLGVALLGLLQAGLRLDAQCRGGRRRSTSCDQQNQSSGRQLRQRTPARAAARRTCAGTRLPWRSADTLSYGFAAASGRDYRAAAATSCSSPVGATTAATRRGVAERQDDDRAGHQQRRRRGRSVRSADSRRRRRRPQRLRDPVGDVGSRRAVRRLPGRVQRRQDLRSQKCRRSFGDKPDLLAGCNWFLDWFNAADNPNFIFKQIACP